MNWLQRHKRTNLPLNWGKEHKTIASNRQIVLSRKLTFSKWIARNLMIWMKCHRIYVHGLNANSVHCPLSLSVCFHFFTVSIAICNVRKSFFFGKEIARKKRFVWHIRNFIESSTISSLNMILPFSRRFHVSNWNTLVNFVVSLCLLPWCCSSVTHHKKPKTERLFIQNIFVSFFPSFVEHSWNTFHGYVKIPPWNVVRRMYA